MVSGPLFREAVVGNVVAIDAECVSDNLGGKVAVVAVDRLLKKIGRLWAAAALKKDEPQLLEQLGFVAG
jgi:hypothetical protein